MTEPKFILTCLCWQTQPIPIPLSPLSTLFPRLRCSVEGLNQELEGMFISQSPPPQHRVGVSNTPRHMHTQRSSGTTLQAPGQANGCWCYILKSANSRPDSSSRSQTVTVLQSLCTALAEVLRMTAPSHPSLLRPPPLPRPAPPPSFKTPTHRILL